MNNDEEALVRSLLGAKTRDEWVRACTNALRCRAVKVSEQTRSVMQAATVRQLQPLSHLSQDLGQAGLVDPPADLLEPVLVGEARARLDEWVECWRASDKLVAAGAPLPGALLLHGPTGTGKTTTSAWLAKRIGVHCRVLDAHHWVDSFLGASGQKLEKAFNAVRSCGGLLVVEEIDTASVRSSDGSTQSQEQTRIVVALMRLIEGARFPVVATTNRLEVVDSALLRRFDEVVELPEPGEDVKRQVVAAVLGAQPAGWDMSRPVVDLVRDARRERRRRALGIAPRLGSRRRIGSQSSTEP